jgi:F-type H+-transporting ATPase subunit delta
VASSAAKRYAQAIFRLGKDCGTLDAWQGDLALLSSIVTDGRIASFLTKPSVAADHKIATLESAIVSWNVQPEARKLARMLIQRDRVKMLPEVRELFDEQMRVEHGVAVAVITTADPLNDAEQELVRETLERLTGKQIQFEKTINQDIIGGIIIRIGDQVIDGSVRNKLEKMRSRLMSGQR